MMQLGTRNQQRYGISFNNQQMVKDEAWTSMYGGVFEKTTGKKLELNQQAKSYSCFKLKMDDWK